jgi:hypothetical protein
MPQASPAPSRPPDGGTREVLVSILIPSLPNAPFAGTVATDWMRTLGDGTTITLANRRAIARDKSGRIFQERRLLVPTDGKHESVVTQIEISDPVAHELHICKPDQHVCQLEVFFPPEFVPPLGAASAPKTPGGPAFEDLGRQSIEGLETVGTRITTVIATGTIGNDNPLLVKREYWYSAQLGVNLLSTLQDPRVGTQKFQVIDISLGDPDSKLFRVPVGSQVIDLRKTSTTSPAQ